MISKVCEIEILHHLDKQKIGVTRLIFKIRYSNFTCKPNFHSITNHIFISMSNTIYCTILGVVRWKECIFELVNTFLWGLQDVDVMARTPWKY